MNVTLLLHPYDEKSPSGLGRMALATARALVAAAPDVHFTIALKRAPRAQPSFPGVNWEVISSGGGIFWLDSLVRRTYYSDVHIFFTPMLPLFVRPKRSIVVVHDFAYRVLPERGLRGRATAALLSSLHRRALRRAWRVVAVSEAIKREAVAFAGIPPEKVAVVYNGVNPVCETAPEAVPEAGERYFLLGGGVKERKNTLAAVEAYAAFVRETNSPTRLAIIGVPRSPYGMRVAERIESLGIASRSVFLGHCSDGQLSYLYTHARAFLFPSLVEGFGMMPVEAMACGTPLLCLDTPVMREVIADGGFLVSPGDTPAFASGLARLDQDGALRSALAEKGRARAAHFSWEKGGQAFARLIRSQT